MKSIKQCKNWREGKKTKENFVYFFAWKHVYNENTDSVSVILVNWTWTFFSFCLYDYRTNTQIKITVVSSIDRMQFYRHISRKHANYYWLLLEFVKSRMKRKSKNRAHFNGSCHHLFNSFLKCVQIIIKFFYSSCISIFWPNLHLMRPLLHRLETCIYMYVYIQHTAHVQYVTIISNSCINDRYVDYLPVFV